MPSGLCRVTICGRSLGFGASGFSAYPFGLLRASGAFCGGAGACFLMGLGAGKWPEIVIRFGAFRCLLLVAFHGMIFSKSGTNSGV